MFIKKILGSILVLTLVSTASSISLHAQESIDEDFQIKSVGSIDEDIYKMVDDYEKGIFVERNESNLSSPQEIFQVFGMTPEATADGNITYLHDIKKIDESQYAATQVALYTSLRQENQDEKNGVIIFCRIVYDQKDFGEPWSYVKLTSVESGVVRNNGNYWCEFLKIK